MPPLPDVSSSLGAVRDRLTILDGMWPTVAYRILGRSPIDNSSFRDVEVLAAHFQASFTAQDSERKVRLNSPLVVEGVAPIDKFDALLKRWQTGETGLLDSLRLRPPAVVPGVWWWEDTQVVADQYPLIESLREFPTRYRESRLIGSGSMLDQEVKTWLQERLADLSPTYNPATFWRDYVNWPWSMDNSLLAIHLPLAIGMVGSYSPEKRTLTVDVHYRPPLKPSDFIVRVGRGPFDASLKQHTPQPAGRDAQHWNVARVVLSREPSATAKAWLTLLRAQHEFGWELTVDLGQVDTPNLRRRHFLSDWYSIGKQDLGREVEVRLPGMGQKDRPSDAFELALANSLGALGYGVLFAGHILKTPGIDLIAFDEASRRAYIVSATVSNDIDRKLKSWLDLELWIRARLEPQWQIRPVIATTQPYSSLTHQDLVAAVDRQVLVLTAESLNTLKETEPDLNLWSELLAADVTTPARQH